MQFCQFSASFGSIALLKVPFCSNFRVLQQNFQRPDSVACLIARPSTMTCCRGTQYELVVRKPVFAYAKTKTQISFAVTAKLISAFVFATRIVQSLYFLNLKFQASSLPLWVCSLVCVGPGRKPQRPVFSQRGSYRPLHLAHSFVKIWS